MATTTAPPPRLHSNHNHAHPQDNYDHLAISPVPSINSHRNSSGNNKSNGNMSTGQPHRDFQVQRPAAPSRASSSGRPSSGPMPSSSSASSTTARPTSPPPAPPAPPPPPRRMPAHPSSSKLQSQSSLSMSHASLNSNSIASASTHHPPPQQVQDSDAYQVKTVNRLAFIRDDEKKSRILNHYLVQKKVGNGQHGQVFYGIDMANNWRAVAIKACRRKNPKDARMEALRKNNPTLHASSAGQGGMVRTGAFGKLKGGKIVKGPAPGERLYDQLEGEEKKVLREIAIMKKCKHGQVVQLYEVIDDRLSHKIFMVMEFMGGGEIKWQDSSRQIPVLTVDQVRRICRDVVLGLEYLHHQGIVHRDIKPANLLWTADRKNVKITDFGVSHFSYAQRLSALKAGRAWRAKASNDPNSQPPSSALSPPSQESGEIPDEDEASALESLVIEEGESFDPILFDTLNDSAYGLSRQAGTPSFLAPEIVWEYREGVLDSLSASVGASASAGSGAWVGSFNSQGQGSSGADWFGQGNTSASGGRMLTQAQDVAPAERQLRTLPMESALGTVDTFGQEKAQQQPRSASAGDFSTGPAIEHPGPAAPSSASISSLHSQEQFGVEGGEPSSSTLSSMDIVGDNDSNSEVGGAIRIRTLPPTPLPDENPMERQQELRLRTQGEDSDDSPRADDSSSFPALSQEQPKSQLNLYASPSFSAPQPSTSASFHHQPSSPSPSPFSLSPSSSSKQRPSLQDFPRPPITKSIDVWALGVTLYCLLTGRTPWTAPHEFALFRAIHAEPVVLPTTVGIDELTIPLSSSSSLPASASSGTTPSSKENESNKRMVSLPLGPIWAEKPAVYGPLPPSQYQGSANKQDDDEGEVVVKLLGGLLEKDYRKRMTLEQVKSLAWITRDIPNPEAWLRETSPYLHDPVRVSADEVNVAVTSLKFEWNPVSWARRLAGRIVHGGGQRQSGGRLSIGFRQRMDADLRSKVPNAREGRTKERNGEEPVVRDYGVQTDKDVLVATERNTKLNRNPSRRRRLLGHLTGADNKDGGGSMRKRLERQSSTPTTSILNTSSQQGASVGRSGTVSGVLTLAGTGETVNRRRALPDLSIETRTRSMSMINRQEEPLFNDSGFDTPRASIGQASASTSNATSPRSGGYTSEEILDEDEELALNLRQEKEDREDAERLQRQKEKGKGKEVTKDQDGKGRGGGIGSKLWHFVAGGKSSQSSSRSSIAGDSTPGSGSSTNKKKSRHAWGRASASATLSTTPSASTSMGTSKFIRMGRRSADEFKTAGSTRGLSSAFHFPYSTNSGTGRVVGAYHSSSVGLSGAGSGSGGAGDDENAFPVLSNNQRANSWGEVAAFYHSEKDRARLRAAHGEQWGYDDEVFGYNNTLTGSAIYGAYGGDFDTTSDTNIDLGIIYDGDADRETEYGLDEDTLMVGAGGVLSNPVSGHSSPGSLSHISVDAAPGTYRDQYQQTIQSATSSMHSPVGDDAQRAPSLMGSPVLYPAGSPQPGYGSSRVVQPPPMLPLPLPLMQAQAEHLLHPTEVAAIANPATQDVIGNIGASGSQVVRRRTSHGQGYHGPKYQLSSPLSQTPLNVDDEEHNRATPPFFDTPNRNQGSHAGQNYQDADVFEESDDSDSESSSKGQRIVYGQGSTNILDDEEVDYGDDDGSGSSEEDVRPIEVKRRRPSESMARSSSQMRRSGVDDGRSAG